ncbi:MAG: type II/IV secretion system protein [Planctomycetes bacterium]|nr:type II/IV secretion system protein [Planctomycetota bacterium]
MLGILARRLEELIRTEEPPSVLVSICLAGAITAGASDVHFEPVEGGIYVRFRLDGVLHGVAKLPPGLAAPVVARLKVLSGLATYRTDVPQDGRVHGDGFASGADLRLSTYPTVRGEKAVVRIHGADASDPDLAGLGLSRVAREALEAALSRRDGLIVLTGPAGSGKTTTIYAAIRHMLARDPVGRQIVTIEDPVERLLPGITQTEVQPALGLTWERCLRSILRQDPEVVVVGEVRDRETAALAGQAALSGHLVLTTLHAGSAAGIFARLVEMGVEPHVVTSTVRVALAQRLARRLCRECRRATAGPDGAPGPWTAPGCPACWQTGFRGRIPVDEVLTLTRRMREAVLASADTTELRERAREDGFADLSARGEELVAAGETSPEELARVLGRAGDGF